MSLAEIQAAIPHRPPMLLVDEIVDRRPDEIICRKTFRAEEFFFQGHYPDHPLVPGVILCECAMQAGAILLAQWIQAGEGIPVATRLNDVKFKRMVRPGESVLLEVKLNERLANAFYLKAKVTCEGELAARFEFACTITEPEQG
jgi:3-hydroxyacyl-[acyl-carrier-protein] dehydratase